MVRIRIRADIFIVTCREGQDLLHIPVEYNFPLRQPDSRILLPVITGRHLNPAQQEQRITSGRHVGLNGIRLPGPSEASRPKNLRPHFSEAVPQHIDTRRQPENT